MAPVIIVPGNNTVRSIGSHVWMALGLVAGLGLGLAAVWTRSPVLLAATRSLRTLAFFWAMSLAAILIGFVVAALLLPLAPITADQQAALRVAAAADTGAVRHAAEQIPTGARFIVELIPSNPVRAAVDGNLLPLIVFTTIFAVAAAALPDEKRHALTDLADVATQALIRIVRWVLLLAPLGIFAIVAGAVA